MYTAGPIKGLTYDGASTWREYVRDEMERLSPWIKTVSPVRGDHAQKGTGQVIMNDSKDHIFTTKYAINQRDFNDVKRADIIFVNLLGTEVVSIGTVMEIAWARAFQKPVVLMMEDDNIHDHPLLRYPAGYITDNLDKGVHVAISVISTDEQMSQYTPKDNFDLNFND
jgi:nucleoside 2-deoxyribosyltransferase